MLPSHDITVLAEVCPGYTTNVDGGMVCVLLPAFEIGTGFTQSSADLLLRLAVGYPDVAPDMWWFSPHVRRLDGREIPATQVEEVILNRTWQRWSRHLGPGQWRPGVDSLESYLSLVRRELRIAGTLAAA